MASNAVGWLQRELGSRRGVEAAARFSAASRPYRLDLEAPGVCGASPSLDALQAGQGALAQERHICGSGSESQALAIRESGAPYFDFFGARFFG
jgi:hypothetical protein